MQIRPKNVNTMQIRVQRCQIYANEVKEGKLQA